MKRTAVQPRSAVRGRPFSAALALGALATAGSAVAGSLTLTPVQATLGTGQRSTSFDLSNPTEEPMVVQVEPRRWSQPDGRDETVPDTGLLVAPTVVRLAPHAHQVVRVALRDTTPAERERSFRVSFRELPPPAVDGRGVRTLVEMTVPVFVAANAAGNATLACRALPDGSLAVTRSGAQHYRFSRLRVLDAAGNARAQRDGLVYVLAGATRRVDLPAHALHAGDRIAFDDAGAAPESCTPGA